MLLVISFRQKYIMFTYLILIGCTFLICDAYRNHLFTIANLDEARTKEYTCLVYQSVTNKTITGRMNSDYDYAHWDSLRSPLNNKTVQVNDTVSDPFEQFQCILHKFLFGDNIELDDQTKQKNVLLSHDKTLDSMRHYVVGNFMRAELFNNKSGVHLPMLEFLHRGHCELNITQDFMQTAVNAFAIFLYGTLEDVERLPADYVLRSSRTISMMKIAREKLAATWKVVRGRKPTNTITYETLELYRPLFKYINAREIARLNMSDERILTYIGTHADLDRHQDGVLQAPKLNKDMLIFQNNFYEILTNCSTIFHLMVGVIANKYVQLNKKWKEPKYLNLMNNLLCGIPMTFMRELPINTYLQLSNQVFYHIRACDPLQRRFYLAIMTRTQALGKSYGWNARDVSRLGLLLAEVAGSDLSAINPKAMTGITAQVMVHMLPENLQHLSLLQLKYIAPKALNILVRKLKAYNDRLLFYNHGNRRLPDLLLFVTLALSMICTMAAIK